MRDGFSGYNQVKVNESEQYKDAFTTPWNTYVYVRIPFGLINVGAAFQRAMDVAFFDLIGLFMAIYQDYLKAYSKKEEDHCTHLEKIFIIAFEYGISQNPKKRSFGVTKGKLLGKIMSKDGVRIDLERVVALDNILSIQGMSRVFNHSSDK